MIVNKRWKTQIIAAIVGILLAFMVVPQTAFAIDPLEVGADVSLQIQYQGNDGAPISGAQFRLYKVGEISRFGNVQPIDAFKDYPVSYENLDSSGWKKLAETLAIYVEMDSIEPLEAAITDELGEIHFPEEGQNMTTGLYLILGETYTYQYQIYTPEPTLIYLPNRDENEEWIYDVVLYPKYEAIEEMTELQVIKQWEDEENRAKKRPEEIEVSLLKEDEVIETVVLNKENNWRYTWTELEASYEWTVVESEVPDDYTVEIERDGETFILTNTYQTSEKTPGTTPEPTLPQTGMLWWPVPILAGAGMLLFAVGWVKRRKSEQ